jgi:hypothetical protein
MSLGHDARIVPCTLGLLAALIWAGRATAQVSPPPLELPQQPVQSQVHVYYPSAPAATALSAQIHAQAAYLRAAGEYAVNAAIARRHHAEAFSRELDNAVKWVETYFKRREINTAERKKQGMLRSYNTSEEKRQQMARERMDRMYQDVLRGDVTGELNWLLRELASLMLAYEYLPGEQALADSGLDRKLDPGDSFHIRLTDGVTSGGKQLVFRADEARLLETHWPLVLRAPEFDAVRLRFDQTRDEVLGKAGKGQTLAYEDCTRLMEAVNGVNEALERAYPLSRRREPSVYLDYISARRYVLTLVATVFRLIESNDPRVFDGSYRFTGETVVDLLDHMYKNGLKFAPPEPGDEGTYQKLFQSMRVLYLQLAANNEVVAQGD